MIKNFVLGAPVVQPSVRQLSANKKAQLERNLMKREARLGATLFGKVPEGHIREFFYLGDNTWVWDEQWVDQARKTAHQLHVRYEFQPRGVLKTVNGASYGYLQGKELENLIKTIYTYGQRVDAEIYSASPA